MHQKVYEKTQHSLLLPGIARHHETSINYVPEVLIFPPTDIRIVLITFIPRSFFLCKYSKLLQNAENYCCSNFIVIDLCQFFFGDFFCMFEGTSGTFISLVVFIIYYLSNMNSIAELSKL